MITKHPRTHTHARTHTHRRHNSGSSTSGNICSRISSDREAGQKITLEILEWTPFGRFFKMIAVKLVKNMVAYILACRSLRHMIFVAKPTISLTIYKESNKMFLKYIFSDTSLTPSFYCIFENFHYIFQIFFANLVLLLAYSR